jgi:hypothetical protein
MSGVPIEVKCCALPDKFVWGGGGGAFVPFFVFGCFVVHYW